MMQFRTIIRVAIALSAISLAAGCESGSGVGLDMTSSDDMADDTSTGADATDDDTSTGADATDDDTSTTDDTSTSADTSTTDDTSTTADADVAPDTMEPASIVVTGPGAVEIPDGGELADPTLDGVPPWSFGITSATLANQSDSAITLTDVSFEFVDETEAIEWYTSEVGSTTLVPVDYSNTEIPAGMAVSVGFYFRPVASGPRDTDVVFTFDDGTSTRIRLVARGRDNATLSPVVENDVYERLFARSNVESSHSMQPGGLSADSAGNLYFNAATNGYTDRFSEDMMFAQILADGSLGWVYEWTEDHEQYQRDIGDNGEIGPTDESISIDGDDQLYFVARRSQSSFNSVFQALVGRIDTATGNMVWARGLTNGTDAEPATAAESMKGHVVDATLSDRVLVAGQIADSAGAFVAALDKSDGSVIWVQRVLYGGTHRIGSIKIVGTTAFISGIANNGGFAARIDGVDGDSPSLGWARAYPGFTIVKGLDADATRLVAAIEVRGAATAFVAASLNPDTGAVLWAKVWDDANSSDQNNTLGVLLDGDTVLAHGRIALSPFDTQGGDGFLLSLDATSGAYQWASFYYTGKGAEELTWHHITGLTKTPAGELYAISQATPASNNKHHFWGKWYQANDYGLDFPGGDGSERLADYGYSGDDVTSSITFEALATATIHDVDTTDVWRTYGEMRLEDPRVLEAEGFQTGVHVLVQRVNVSQ